MSQTRLVMEQISKQFGVTRALDGVDLELQPGEIHAIVGENGAGKSTLMAVLSGSLQPDRGRMVLDGAEYRPVDPRDARTRGVSIVHQELFLLPHLSVEANVVLGVESSRFGFLRRGVDRQRTLAVLRELNHAEIEPATPVRELGVAARQIVEIARGLLLDVKILILDEPTAALNRDDASRLFQLIRRLRDRGVTVVLISHFLEEVEAIADRYTVLRDGRRVVTGTRSGFNREKVIEQMIGRPVSEQYPRTVRPIGEPILTLEELQGERGPVDVNLTLRRGEILGLAGLVGAGRTELLRAIFGLDAVVSGRVIVGQVSSPSGDPSCRVQQGLGMQSEDRKGEGLALSQSVLDNLTWSRLRPFASWGLLRVPALCQAAQECLSRLNVRYSDVRQPVGTLSGGNQQKVALGRLLHQQADVWLLDEPTKGIDVASKSEIYHLMNQLAASGKAVLWVSSYLPELLGICDRIAVMRRGRLVEVREATRWTPNELLAVATGVPSATDSRPFDLVGES